MINTNDTTGTNTDTKKINYILHRSRRRSIALHISTVSGAVEVRAPLRAPKKVIDEFVASKEKWITKNLEIAKEIRGMRNNFSLNYGDLITYRGKQYPINAAPIKRARFDGEQFCIPCGLTSDEIKRACVNVYRKLAKRDITERAFNLAQKLAVAPKAVKITGAKGRWGSCTAARNINFTWYLIKADDDVIDYVIIHELAHLKVLNHSSRFWEIVKNVLPDYRERREKLYNLQKTLSRENWNVKEKNRAEDKAENKNV